MHAVDLADTVHVEQLPPGMVPRYAIRWAKDAPRPSPIDWSHDKDLGARAVAVMEKQTGRRLPAALTITKRIPVGGGLGGGSSDAAATMLALDELFDLRVPTGTLAEWSRSLGSDAAFFLDDANPPRPAFVGGFGDRIERTLRASADLTMVLPDFGCATPSVYKAFDSLAPGPLDPTAVLAAARAAAPAAGVLTNDLTRAACAAEPRLSAVITRAENALGRPVHMSGSGSTLFALGLPETAKLDGCVLIPARLV